MVLHKKKYNLENSGGYNKRMKIFGENSNMVSCHNNYYFFFFLRDTITTTVMVYVHLLLKNQFTDLGR